MKTRDVIRLLNEADPTGDCEVSIGNRDIECIGREPAYYDGCQQLFVRVNNDPEGKVIGFRYNSTPNAIKIVIEATSITEMLHRDHNLPIDYSGLSSLHREHYVAEHKAAREMMRQIIYEVERDAFRAHVSGRVGTSPRQHNTTADVFFNANLWPALPFPDDLRTPYRSYDDRRTEHWTRIVDASLAEDGALILTMRVPAVGADQ